MYYCICYFIGMTIVLTHNTYYTTDNKIYFDNQYPKLTDILKDMYNGNGLALCGLEGFINLFFYDVNYIIYIIVSIFFCCPCYLLYLSYWQRVAIKFHDENAQKC